MQQTALVIEITVRNCTKSEIRASPYGRKGYGKVRRAGCLRYPMARSGVVVKTKLGVLYHDRVKTNGFSGASDVRRQKGV